jgi:hypothetical protein
MVITRKTVRALLLTAAVLLVAYFLWRVRGGLYPFVIAFFLAYVLNPAVDWLERNRVETMTAHILTPYPGTVLYRRMEAEGRILDRDPRHYNTAHVVFQPRQMTPEELREGYLWIYDSLYSWANILRRMPCAPEQRLPYLAFNLIYRKFGRLTAGLAQRLGGMHRFGGMARRLAYGIG